MPQEQAHIEVLRQELIAEFDTLATLQLQANATVGPVEPFTEGSDSSGFDDVEVESFQPMPALKTGIEWRPLALPSTCPLNSDQCHEVELQIHMESASQHIAALRELIAERSFQYMHVICVAPWKGIMTCAHESLAKLNHTVAFHCSAYRRCQVAMERLHATSELLEKYQIIRPEDIKTSTALLDHNKPGSTSLRLSWIWQVDSFDSNASASALRECK